MMDAGECSKRVPGSSGIGRKREIDLDYLIPHSLAFVPQIHIERKRLTCCQAVSGKTQTAVCELRIGQAITKWIERLACKEAIGSVGHRIVSEGWQLIYAG